jgi:hypothetical protein
MICPLLKLQEALPQLSFRISPSSELQLQLISVLQEFPSSPSTPIRPELKLQVFDPLQAKECSDSYPICAPEATQLQADSPLQTDESPESKASWSPPEQ